MVTVTVMVMETATAMVMETAMAMEMGTEMATARASGNVASVSAAEGSLSTGLSGLFAVDDRYPELKANALFHEFEETGLNRQLGYSSPADLIDKFPGFYWNSVAMHLGEATTYLDLTASGRQWIANLHHHVMSAEQAYRFMGPQR